MITLDKIRFSYPAESFELRLQHFRIEQGESVALLGPSGCGKSTLMNLISGILLPAEGVIQVNGVNIGALGLAARQRFRLETIGLVPQNFELLDYLTIRENILVPFRISCSLGLTTEARLRCEFLAERAGITRHLGKYPGQLSQGERQRAALCRGLVTSPRLILADEPTGNLDPQNQDCIVALLLDEAKAIGSSVVMITHDPGLLHRFDRSIYLQQLLAPGGAA